jgi:hypothetical protein
MGGETILRHSPSLHELNDIMRATLLRTLFVSLACAAPLWSFAQQQAPQAPPVLQPLEEGAEPAITIRKEDGEKRVTEKREGGKVTEIKVQSGKSTYYLKPNDQAGSAQPGDAQGTLTRPPQWKVKEFDLGAPKNPKEAATVDAPPPAPAAADTPKK